MFSWKVHFFNSDGAGYTKQFKAWTKQGAKRKARIYTHVGWTAKVIGRA